MLKQLLLLIAFISLVSCQSTSGGEVTEDAQTGTSVVNPIKDEEQKFLDILNSERSKQGLKLIELHQGLSEIASNHSINMENRTVPFGHAGFAERCSDGRKALGGGNLCSENVAMGQKNVNEVFKSWLNSSGHRDNMLNARITHVGLGVSPIKSGTLYWTLILLEKK